MIRHSARLLLAGAVFFGGTALLSTEASAQATRTWVSGVGDDANPCSRTAPCKTFQGTIAKTAAGGEINCIDAGGFGAVTITKSITIKCDNVEAGVLVSGQNGIVVNDGGAGTVQVTLDGLDLEGIGFSTGGSGIRGIWFISGASLTVRRTTIRNFRDGTNGTGISFTPSTAAKLLVEDTILTGNGNTGVGGGIIVQPTGTGTANVTLNRVTAFNNTNNGFSVNTAGATAAGVGVNIAITNSVFSGNSGTGIGASNPASTTGVKMIITETTSNNNNVGLVSNGANSVMRVGNSTVSGNTSFGVLAVGAGAGLGILSYTPASNHVNGNGTDGTFSGTVPAL